MKTDFYHQVNKGTASPLLQAWRQHSKDKTVNVFIGRHRVLKLRHWLVKVDTIHLDPFALLKTYLQALGPDYNPNLQWGHLVIIKGSKQGGVARFIYAVLSWFGPFAYSVDGQSVYATKSTLHPSQQIT